MSRRRGARSWATLGNRRGVSYRGVLLEVGRGVVRERCEVENRVVQSFTPKWAFERLGLGRIQALYLRCTGAALVLRWLCIDILPVV